jgi:hypothetical protein
MPCACTVQLEVTKTTLSADETEMLTNMRWGDACFTFLRHA